MKLLKSPILNAILAAVYIIAVVCVMNYASQAAINVPEPMIGVAMLSLFTLSAAMMGAFFLLQPIQLYVSGKKKESVGFFFETLSAFAIITLTLFLVMFSGILNF